MGSEDLQTEEGDAGYEEGPMEAWLKVGGPAEIC